MTRNCLRFRCPTWRRSWGCASADNTAGGTEENDVPVRGQTERVSENPREHQENRPETGDPEPLGLTVHKRRCSDVHVLRSRVTDVRIVPTYKLPQSTQAATSTTIYPFSGYFGHTGQYWWPITQDNRLQWNYHQLMIVTGNWCFVTLNKCEHLQT